MTKEERQEKQDRRNRELIEAVKRFDLTITSDGKCEVIEAEDMPDSLSLIDLTHIIDLLRKDNDREGLLSLAKQLESIRDYCTEKLDEILGVESSI